MIEIIIMIYIISQTRLYMEAYLGHQEKKFINLPGQDNYALICPGKIIILPRKDKCPLICPGMIIIFPGQDKCPLICPGKIIILQDNYLAQAT